MTRQYDNVGAYLVTRADENYLVELRHLKNTEAGNPRYEAVIFDLDCVKKYAYTGGHSFTFTGHYFGDQGEAEWIVNYFLYRVEKMHK